MSSNEETIQVPTELMELAQRPIFHSTLLSIRDQSGINYICVNRNSDTGGFFVAMGAQSPDHTAYAKNLIEAHFEEQLKLKLENNGLESATKSNQNIELQFSNDTDADADADIQHPAKKADTSTVV